jgi:hypothetical protein
MRTIIAVIRFLGTLSPSLALGQKPSCPSFDNEAARGHEIKPHRRKISREGGALWVPVGSTSFA